MSQVKNRHLGPANLHGVKEVGRIVSFFAGVAKIRGLPGVFLREVLLSPQGRPAGLVVGFDEDLVDALIFDELYDTRQPLFRSFSAFSIPATRDYLGLVVNGLGEPFDKKEDLQGSPKEVFAPAPQIIEREPVKTPLTTGIKIIDTTLPLGRGQRQLLVGDRKLGKSTLAIDTVLNQKEAQPPVFCVYVLCGQKQQKLKELVNLFEQENAFLYSTVVAATAEASLAETYLAPFVGCAVAEFFRDQGQDALVVYDDLSRHAKAYRDIALLLERSPGREAYPGDIFSLHASLLERAAKLRADQGGGSLTALPILETQEGDLTAFIPTNLVSITDGQIYFERGLFQKGFLPAVNVGLSVSRVGSAAQPPPLKNVTGGLRLALAQHRELQKLAQLETRRSQAALKKINRGELLLTLLKQTKHTKVGWEQQTVLFYAVEKGFFDQMTAPRLQHFEEFFLKLIESRYDALLKKIGKEGITPAVERQIEKAVLDFRREFLG